MKSAAFLLCVIACGVALPSQAAELSGVQSVYLLPMSNGLDQYLASRLSAAGLFQVVVDPKKAEAIFTDRIGEAFEERLDTIFPPAEAAKASQRAVVASSFGKGKGTIFLVGTATRSVLWSAYEKPKNTTPDELDRTAQRIVDGLKASLKPKKK